MRIHVVASLVALTSICLAAQSKFNPVGAWHPRILLNEKKLKGSPKDFVDPLRHYADTMKDSWVVMVRRDHTYVLPGKNGAKNSEEGTWSVHGDKFTLTVKTQGGKAVKKGKHGVFVIGSDHNTLTANPQDTSASAFFQFYRSAR